MAPTGPIPQESQVYYEVYTGAHVTGTGTTTVKTGEGLLYCITINTKGLSANTLTVTLDGATLGVIDTTAATQSLFFLAKYYTSLAVTSTTGTGADLTISYL